MRFRKSHTAASVEYLLRVSSLSAQVSLGNGQKLTTVDNVNFEFLPGKSYAVVGKSGSGKTSLISILGLLNTDFMGEYFYRDTTIRSLSDRKLSKLRGAKIGFVFQNYSLIKHLRVSENIELALEYSPKKLTRKQRKQKINAALKAVGLQDKARLLPNKLSGGEQQRVAIARALVTDPQLIICDEPTGALDNSTGKKILDILHDRVKNSQATLILVTHDEDVAKSCEHILRMDNGKITDVIHAV